MIARLKNSVILSIQVNVLNIGYARTAKNVDMKKLKHVMWNVITTRPDQEQDKENISRDVNTTKELPEKSSQPGSFFSIYDSLLSRVPKKMSEDMSVPLAFTAILHLANEKTLRFESVTDLGDFFVHQEK